MSTEHSSNVPAGYSDIERAVYERAQQLHLQQAALARSIYNTAPAEPPPPPPPKQQYYRSGKKKIPIFNGQNSAGNWKRRAPPKPQAETQHFFCELCNVTCIGDQSYQSHLVGKSHKRKEDVATGKTSLNAASPAYKCEICNTACTSKETYQTHINGAKHSRALKNLQSMGRPVPESALPTAAGSQGVADDPMENLPVMSKVIGVTSTKFVGGVKLSSTGGEEGALEAAPDEAEVEPIGEEFLEPLIGGGKKTSFRCKICDCVCGDPVAKGLHVRGRRHRIAYKQKVDPSLDVDGKSGANAFHPHQNIQPGPFFGCGPPPSFRGPMPSGGFMMPLTQRFDAHDERHVIAKLDELRPEAATIEAIECLLNMVEKTLLKLSTALVEASVKTENADAQSSEATSSLRGVVRVGVAGDRLIVRGDRRFSAVLLCRDTPTVTLLQSVAAAFVGNVEANRSGQTPARVQQAASLQGDELRAKTTVRPDVARSGFEVSFIDCDLECFVTLALAPPSSPPPTAEQKDANESTPSKAAPLDALPQEPSECALAEMRRTKFFHTQSLQTPIITALVMLIRDIGERIETWRVLPLYTIELMAYKLLSTQPPIFRLSDAFRRFFELLSAGVLLGNKRKLLDPCEKDERNVLAHLLPQQRENLMCSAQHALRLVAYDQIHVVLGCSPQVGNEARKRQAEDDEEIKVDEDDESKRPKPS